MSDQEELKRLIVCRHSCIVINTVEEEYALVLLREIAIDRSRNLWEWTSTQGLREGLLAGSPVVPDSQHPAGALYHIAYKQHDAGIYVLIDIGGFLKDDKTLRILREAIEHVGNRGGLVVLIDSCELPHVIRAVSTEFRISFPDEEELSDIVHQTVQKLNEEQRLVIDLTRAELQLIVKNLRGLSRRQARQIIVEAVLNDHRFDAKDINTILIAKRRMIGSEGLLDFVDSPVNIDEIGGLSRLKAWLADRQGSFRDEAAAFGLPPPRGLLMLGVQGAGKSLAAKAVATAWRQPLLRMDVGALYDRYIGESERRLREALQQAERMSPIILWIDEIEKGFASAASQSSDGGLSKRMFGALLTWMQEHTAPVFIIATANDIEALPPELLRKGRFDEIFFVDLPNLEARATICAIHLRKRKRDPKNFDIGQIAEASDGFSGAEIEQAIIAALHDAFAAGKELCTPHIIEALRRSPPLSVTMKEKVAELRCWASARCVPAD